MSLARRYTRLEDRLAKEWYGKVWAGWTNRLRKSWPSSSSEQTGPRPGENWMLPGHENVLALLETLVAISAARHKETQTLNLVFLYYSSSLARAQGQLDVCEVQL